MSSGAYNSYLAKDGGYVIKSDSRVCREIEKLLARDAKDSQSSLLPVYKERGVYNFYLRNGKRGGVKALSSTEMADLSKLSKDKLVQMLGELRISTSSGSRQPSRA